MINDNEMDDSSAEAGIGLEPNLAATLIQNQIQDAKSSVNIFELPCGYLDRDGTLHREVKVREITGHEEDMLANPKMATGAKINGLISQCIERVGTVTDRGMLAEVVKGMTVGDRLFAIFAIRRVTVGDLYTFEAKCPKCDAVGPYTVDLSELELKAMEDPYKRLYTVKLPKSGLEVSYHPMTGHDEAKLAQLDKKKTDSLSLSIAVRIDSISGEKPSLAKVKGLSMADRMFLRGDFDKHEGGVNTEVELDCPSCSETFKQDLDVGQPSFFFPSVAQKS